MNDTDTSEKKRPSAKPPQLKIDQLNHVVKHMSSPESSPSSPCSPHLTRDMMLPRLYRLVRSSQLFVLALILFSLTSIYVMLDSLQHYQRDVSGCQTTYMRPEYIKQTGFDSEMTRFASKYALYLYREKGVDYNQLVSSLSFFYIFFGED